MCHYESPPYFLVDLVSFSRYLHIHVVVAPTIDAGFGENYAVFMQSLSQTEHFVQSHSCFVAP